MHLEYRGGQAPQVEFTKGCHGGANGQLVRLPDGHVELAQPVDGPGYRRVAGQRIAQTEVAGQLAGVNRGTVGLGRGPGTKASKTKVAEGPNIANRTASV